MFEDLSSKFDKVFKFIKGKGKVSEATIDEFLREVRRILLDADVNYKVVKQFVDDVKQRRWKKMSSGASIRARS